MTKTWNFPFYSHFLHNSYLILKLMTNTTLEWRLGLIFHDQEWSPSSDLMVHPHRHLMKSFQSCRQIIQFVETIIGYELILWIHMMLMNGVMSCIIFNPQLLRNPMELSWIPFEWWWSWASTLKIVVARISKKMTTLTHLTMTLAWVTESVRVHFGLDLEKWRKTRSTRCLGQLLVSNGNKYW